MQKVTIRKWIAISISRWWMAGSLLGCSFGAIAQVNDSVAVSKHTLLNYFRPKSYNILFGTQASDKVVQSLGYLPGRELEKSPVSLLSNALQGRMAGLYSNQTSGTV